MPRRRRKGRSRPLPGTAAATYREDVREADRIIAEQGDEVRADNWRQLAVKWFAPEEPDRGILERYMEAHAGSLGSEWTRQFVRFDVLLRAEDYAAVLEHYGRALSGYPACPLVEMWVGYALFRFQGDFWGARRVLLSVYQALPRHPKAPYELGFLHFLVGDLAGAREWFDRAAQTVDPEESELASRIFFNRGVTRYHLNQDLAGAIADMEEALRRRPDYTQARLTLRELQRRSRGGRRW